MTANMRIVPRNFHDDATLYVELPVVSGFPIENTQNTIRSRVWRSATSADQYVLGVFDDALDRTINFFGFFRHMCHGGAVRLQLYQDTAWTDQVYDSGVRDVINIANTEGYDWGIDPYQIGAPNDPFITSSPYWIYFPDTQCLSYKISFSGNVSNFGASFWQVCRFWLGKYFEVGRNPAFGAQIGFADLTDRNRSLGGSLRTNLGAYWKTMSLDLAAMDESDRATWLDIMQYTGTGRDFVISWFPEDGTRRERDHIINGKFTSLDAIGRPIRILTKKLQLEEV